MARTTTTTTTAILAVLVLACTVCVSGGTVGRVGIASSPKTMSQIAYGTLHLVEVETPEAALLRIHECLKHGITTFDLADVYAGGDALDLFAAALALEPSLRSQIEVVAKMDIVHGDHFSFLDTTPEHLGKVVEMYLEKLNTTYLDFVLLHWPDPLVDLDRLANVFVDLEEAGVVHHFGVSNYNVAQIEALQRRLPFPLVTNEIEVSVLVPDRAFDGSIQRMDMPILAWGPLGGDPFAGENRLFKVDGQQQREIREGLQYVADQLGSKEDIVAVAWLLRIPHPIIPILGTVRLDRISDQAQAVEVAQRMTLEQWWWIADAAGKGPFGDYVRPRP